MDAGIGTILKTVLPVIGTALGGPLAGMAVKFFADKLGVPTEKVEDIENWLRGATPDEVLKAKTADQEFQLKMAELGFKDKMAIEELNQADRASAREREVKTGDSTPKILAYMIIGSFISVVIYILGFKSEMDSDMAVLSGTLIGYLSAKAEQICSYYFGSTKGSADKTEALSAALSNSIAKKG